MRTMHKIDRTDMDKIYIYDWYQERMQSASTPEKFRRTVLDNEYYYKHYLDNQNLSGKDLEPPYENLGTHYEIPDFLKVRNLKKYSICRHRNGDYYDILDIRNLKRDIKQDHSHNDKKVKYAYEDKDTFRKMPVRHTGKINYAHHKRYRQVKHVRMVLNELARYQEDKEYVTTNHLGKLKNYTFYVSYYEDYHYISKSWKSQSKKRKQWM